MLIGLCGGIANTIPYVSVIMLVVLFAWIYATLKMGIIVDKAISSDATLTLEEEKILSSTVEPMPVPDTATVSEA